MKKKSVKIVPSNPNFKKLKYNALRYFHGSECHVEIEENTPLTVGGVVKVTESLTISIADGSWIEIGSGDQLNQLEIRTIAAPNGKGKGTYLMKVFLLQRNTEVLSGVSKTTSAQIERRSIL